MRIYGVTGTSGKTTTVWVLDAILAEEFGRDRVGMISTELFRVGAKEVPNETHMTSINSRKLNGLLRQMRFAGVKHVVIEMTSHALDQKRMAGLKLAGAIITNITREHLDYHKTMSSYAAAKGKIVNYLVPDGILVGNASDKWASRILHKAQSKKHKTQSFTHEQAQSVKTSLLGDFNKENVLAAMTLARAVGVPEEAIAKGVAEIKQVPGRLEWLNTPWGARVMIDFAQTPNEYERLYQSLRSQVYGKLIGVFGAAGRRDREKRPVIAKTVAQYADEIILTQDEPYGDPEDEIYAGLEAGLTDAIIPCQRIEDRREAMKYAIEKTRAGDVVAVTGMGNYTTRAVGEEMIPWNDKKIAEELIRERGI